MATAYTVRIIDRLLRFDTTANDIVATLLPFAQTPNASYEAHKISVGDGHIVTIRVDPANVDFLLADGSTSIVLDDTSSTALIKIPANGSSPAFVALGGGGGGSGGGVGAAPVVTAASATIYYSDDVGNVLTYPGDTNATDYGFLLSFDLPADTTHLKSLQVYATSESGWRNPAPILDVPRSFLTTDPVVDLPTSHWKRPEADQTFQKLQFYSLNEVGQPSPAVEYTGGGPPSTLKVLGRPAPTGGGGGAGVAPDPVTSVTVTVLEVGIDATTSDAKQHLKVSYAPPVSWATNPADIIYAYLQRGTGPDSAHVTWAPINVDPNDSAADNAGANRNSIGMWVERPTPNDQWARVFVVASRSDFTVFLDVLTDPVSAVFALLAEVPPHSNDITNAVMGSVSFMQRDDGTWYWGVNFTWTNPTLQTDIEFLLAYYTVQRVKNDGYTDGSGGGAFASEVYGEQRWGIGEANTGTFLDDIPLAPFNRYLIRLYVVNDRNVATLQTTAWSGQPYGHVDVDHTPTTPLQTVTGASLSAVTFPQADNGSFYGTVTVTATAPTLQQDPAFLLMKMTVQQTDASGNTAAVGGAGYTSEQVEREMDEQWIAGKVLSHVLIFSIPSDTLPDGTTTNPYIYLQFRIRVVNSDGVETIQNAWAGGVSAARFNARTGAPVTVTDVNTIGTDPTLRVHGNLLGSSTPNSDTLAANSYFEDGNLDGWTEDFNPNNDHISIDSTHAKSGVYCMKTIPIPGNSLLVVRNDLWVPVSPGETYFVSIDVAAGPGTVGTAGASAAIYDVNQAIFTSGEQHFTTPDTGPTPPSPAFTYVNLHATFTVPATLPSGLPSAFMRMTLIIYNYSAGNWYLDNAVVQPSSNAKNISSVSGSVISVGSITSDKIGSIDATTITVNQIQASQIGSIAASTITVGTLTASQIGSVNATAISGSITAGQIASVNATAISGQIQATQIAAVNATSISGSITASQISTVNAGSITGVIVTAQLADQILNTMTKFSTGIFGTNLVNNGTTMQIGTSDTQNMQPNPSFESDFKDWNQSQFQIDSSGSASFSGTKVAFSSISGASLAGALGTGGIGTTCKPGDAFTVSFYGKSTAGATGRIKIAFQWRNGTGGSFAESTPVYLNPTSTVYTVCSTGPQVAPAGAGYFIFYLSLESTTGTWYVDNVTLLHAYDSSLISSVNASSIVGSINSAQIGSINASSIVGLIVAAQIQSLAASQLTGAITAAQITSITAGQITGQITGSQIGSLTITGGNIASLTIQGSNIATATITSAQIGSLDAGKINAGTFTGCRMTLNSSGITASFTDLNIAGFWTGVSVKNNSQPSQQGYVADQAIGVVNPSGSGGAALDTSSGYGRLVLTTSGGSQTIIGTGFDGHLQCLVLLCGQIWASNAVSAGSPALGATHKIPMYNASGGLLNYLYLYP